AKALCHLLSSRLLAVELQGCAAPVAQGFGPLRGAAYTAVQASRTAGHVKRDSSSCARAAISSARSRRSSVATIAAAITRGSFGGTISPVSLSRTIEGMSPAGVLITGRPDANASRIDTG